MVTKPKIMIISLLCAVFMDKHFYINLGEEFLYTKILGADLNLSLLVFVKYFIYSNL